MQLEYEHEQAGTLQRFIFGLFLSLLGALAAQAWVAGNWETAIPLSVPVVILIVIFALFHSLTIRVSPNAIQLWFGIGWIKKSFQISDIDRAFATRTHWYNGWGIRMIRRGWLYNVSGFDAIELVLKNGRRYQLGTDEPEELLAAVQSALKKSN